MNENQELADYLKPTEFIDSDNPDIVSKAGRTHRRLRDEKEKLGNIYYFVRDFPYDILDSFPLPRRGKAPGERRAEQRQGVLHGQGQHVRRPCRASGIPSRIGFQQLYCPITLS